MSKVVVADYDYTGEDESQLSFNEGDRIIVLEEDETGWWTGRLIKNGNEGYFPSTYIKPIDEEQGEEEEEEEYEEVIIQDDDEEDDNDENQQLQVNEDINKIELRSVSNSSISYRDENNNGNNNIAKKTKKLNNKKYEMQKAKSASEPEQYIDAGDDTKKEEMDNNDNIKQTEFKKGEGTTHRTTSGGDRSVDIDYNNYFVNAQEIVSIPDDFEGEESALCDNYYSAEVLNLKFNPNANTRYGLVSHYMSLFASIGTFFLGTSAFAWSNGSDWLKEEGFANSDICLIIGFYAFFVSIIMFIWEYIRGDIRLKRSIPFRSILYFCIGLPLFFTLTTSLGGILWINTTIYSFLSWKNRETYERKKKKAFSDEMIKTPKERLFYFFNISRLGESIRDRCIEIRQQSQVGKYIFVFVYLLFNIIYISYWASFYSDLVSAVNDAANKQSAIGDFSVSDLNLISNRNTSPGDSALILTSWFPIAKMFGNLLDINCAFILFPVCRSFISQLYNISTDQRGVAKCFNFLLSFMPLDKALQFHKLCAFLIIIGTIFHSWAHYNHFAFVPSTYEEVFGATVWISGCIIIISMHFLYCTSFAAVRHGKFELFWYTHHLFVIFFISIIFHGANSINPNFWKWLLVPGILYMIERSIRSLKARQAVGVVSIVHMNNKNARIFCLELEKTGPIKNHQEGQYVFIRAPIISKLEWHPFTISSPPDKKNINITYS